MRGREVIFFAVLVPSLALVARMPLLRLALEALSHETNEGVPQYDIDVGFYVEQVRAVTLSWSLSCGCRSHLTV